MPKRLIKLKNTLNEKGYTQRYLALQAHMSEIVLSQAMTGERELLESQKIIISKILGKDKEFLFPD